MPLQPGSRIGPYEVAVPIGAGGMGEVCRARDSKQNREVALKVLPDALANDAVAGEAEPPITVIYNFPKLLQRK